MIFSFAGTGFNGRLDSYGLVLYNKNPLQKGEDQYAVSKM
jgi:hypothetical protein